MLEETEGYREIIKSTSQASDEGHGMQCFEAELHEKSGSDEEQMRVLECGRWAVEARRTGREKSKSNGGRRTRTKHKPGARREVRFGEEETVRGDASGEHRRAGGDEKIFGGENRKRKRRPRPRERREVLGGRDQGERQRKR